jgi:1,2-dihydroxy-3-keto-5-methylthiopentene dioxygenase
MARVTDRDGGRCLSAHAEVESFLAEHSIWYRRLGGALPSPGAIDEEVLAHYAGAIAALQKEGGYVCADVISVAPDTPDLEHLMQKFAAEHVHTEDEVRLVVDGRGLFHVRPRRGPVFSVEIQAGDVINVPAGTRHWFHLCEDRSIRAVRLFRDPAGWVPEYTGSGVDAAYQPLCFQMQSPRP